LSRGLHAAVALREDEMWVEEQVVGERGLVGNTEEGHEPDWAPTRQAAAIIRS